MNRAARVAPELETRGGNILALLAALGLYRSLGERLLADRGIADVREDGWYSLQCFVAVLEEIERRVGPHTMFQIGRQIPEFVRLPERVRGFEEVCAAFDKAFDLNHRGGDAGGIGYSVTGSRSAVIVTTTPYPCDFDRGVIQGFFQRFQESRVSVERDPSRPCKSEGGLSCTYRVHL